MVLKLVGTSNEEGMLLERFRAMWPDGKASDLQSILTLKGISKNEQIKLLEAYGILPPPAPTSTSTNTNTYTNNNNPLLARPSRGQEGEAGEAGGGPSASISSSATSAYGQMSHAANAANESMKNISKQLKTAAATATAGKWA